MVRKYLVYSILQGKLVYIVFLQSITIGPLIKLGH